MNPKVAFILGTRPEIIKMAPVIRECQNRGVDFFLTHTNQHYSVEMDHMICQDLNLVKPHYELRIGSGSHGEQTGKMLANIEKVLIKEQPTHVLVHGDTNTTLAGALAARKLLMKVGHVEAGLRSRDMAMPEEVNRILVDDISDYLFAPTLQANNNLLAEGKPLNKVYVVGNTVVDAVQDHTILAKEKSNIMADQNLKEKDFFLITAHRPANVDKKIVLQNIFEGMDKIAEKYNAPIVFPIHPRTQKMLDVFEIKPGKSIICIPPVGYFDMLLLIQNARLVFTDSGGLQEEACILQTPCVTLRDNTERPETLEVEANILSKRDSDDILAKAQKMLAVETDWDNPFGEGNTSQKILKYLLK